MGKLCQRPAVPHGQGLSGTAERGKGALNGYQSKLSDPKVSFSVKYCQLRSLDEARISTLEMESYSRTGPGRIAHVRSEEASVVATMQDVGGSNCSKIP